LQLQSHAVDTLRMACEGQQWALQQTCQFTCLQMASVPSCEPVVHAIHFMNSQNCLQQTGLHMFQAWRFRRHKLICACDFCMSHMAEWLADITPTKGEGHSPQRWLPNFERKFPLQGYKLQRLSIDVPLQRQGMCVPEDQSKRCSTCCIGHQLPIWLHSQPFWSLMVWTVSASDKHLTWFTMQLFPLGSNVMFLSVLSDLNKTCWLKHFKTNKLVEYTELWLLMQMWDFSLQNLDFLVAQNSIEQHFSFSLTILRSHCLLTILLSPKDSKCDKCVKGLSLHATRSNGAEAVTLSKAVLTSRHVGVLVLSVWQQNSLEAHIRFCRCNLSTKEHDSSKPARACSFSGKPRGLRAHGSSLQHAAPTASTQGCFQKS